MIISHLCGGLGNQMFQYALGRRLSIELHATLKLDLSEYATGAEIRPAIFEQFRRPLKLYELNVTTPAATRDEIDHLRDPHSKPGWSHRFVRLIRQHVPNPNYLWPATHVREKQYRFDPRILAVPSDVYLQGFFQSWRYFDTIEETLHAEFQPKDAAIRPYAEQHVDRIRQLGGDGVVALHIRRGDMAHAYDINRPDLIHTGPLGLDYHFEAMSRFGPRFRFLIFSDTPKDIEWCRQNVRPDWLPPEQLHFSEGHTDIQDMSIMTACDHHIIANSTFSWWAAWLNPRLRRRIIAPSHWSAPGAKIDMVTDDLIPPGWEII